MAKVVVYDTKGEKTKELKLDPEIFDKKINERLLFEVTQAYLSNRRQATAKTKKRGEVSGGGRKPWRQKGTGRARTGSIRNPLFRGGGIIFGPTGEQNYKKVIPQKKRKAALLSALSSKAGKDQILIVGKLEFKKPKTRDLIDILSKLPVEGQILLVISEKDFNLAKSASNIPNVYVTLASNLNALEILGADRIIFVKDSLEKLENRVKGVKKEVKKVSKVGEVKEVSKVEKKKETEPKGEIKKIKSKKKLVKSSSSRKKKVKNEKRRK